MVVDPAFWRGRRVLVTGHTGFKGGWLALWLEELGAEVTGFATPPPTDPSLFELARVADGVHSIEGDVRDLDAVGRAVGEARPEVVFHMAAQPLVRHSFEDPVGTYATNVMGTVNVLEAVRRAGGVGAIVNVTSDKCYENREWEWGYREDEPKGGRDPYSSSKGCAELVTAAYRSSYFAGAGAALASARAGNVIGGGDWGADRLVPDAVRAALDGRPLLVRNPDSIRPWQHVLEPLSGYLMLAQGLWSSPEYADGWNFGPDDRDARTVRWLADRLAELWDGLEWREDGADHPSEARYLKLDSSRARLRLGWEPRWSLDRALEAVVDWYRAYAGGGDVREATLRQVREHQSTGSAAIR